MKTSNPQASTHTTCPCCTTAPDRTLHRRRFLSLAAGGAVAGLLMPRQTLAAGLLDEKSQKKYKALALSCIDPRVQSPVAKYLEERLGKNNYSQVNVAGAAIGAMAPRFEGWHETFWENLSISLKLHRFPEVIVIQHRKCGAASEAYGYFQPNARGEEELHRAVVANFKKELHQRHPQLMLHAVLMDLQGGTPKDLLKT